MTFVPRAAVPHSEDDRLQHDGDLLTPVYPIDAFVAKLRLIPQSAFLDTEQISKFVAEHPVDPATLEPYLFWDSQRYTRNLIDKTALYELLAICWDSGHTSSVHNHHDQNCWMAVPIGRLMVQNYRVLHQDLEAGRCRIEKMDLVEMNRQSPQAVDPDAPVHSISNPREFQSRAVSLHIYAQPYDSCIVYSEENQTCRVIGLSYTSVAGKREVF